MSEQRKAGRQRETNANKRCWSTEPELILHVAEASSVVPPVPEELHISILSSEEDLREGKGKNLDNSYVVSERFWH